MLLQMCVVWLFMLVFFVQKSWSAGFSGAGLYVVNSFFLGRGNWRSWYHIHKTFFVWKPHARLFWMPLFCFLFSKAILHIQNISGVFDFQLVAGPKTQSLPQWNCLLNFFLICSSDSELEGHYLGGLLCFSLTHLFINLYL